VYRIFFTVDDETNVVRVVHVRRGARQRPIAEELKDE
jgi:mRNA-degrading endonuclease RelE of RelBE toxin-antitoxin system